MFQKRSDVRYLTHICGSNFYRGFPIELTQKELQVNLFEVMSVVNFHKRVLELQLTT